MEKLVRKIGLVAHDAMKKDLIEWVLWNSELLMGHKFYCTGTTGTLILAALKEKHPDVKALTRLASVENIVFCCNRSTADHIISSPLFLDPTYERTVPDYSNYAKRFENKQVVAEAVESAKKRKKKQ